MMQVAIYEYRVISSWQDRQETPGSVRYRTNEQLEEKLNGMAKEGYAVIHVVDGRIIMGRVIGTAKLEVDEPRIAAVQLGAVARKGN